METVKETTQLLLGMYGGHLGFNDEEKVELGYVGYSNKKFQINSDEELQKHLQVVTYIKEVNSVWPYVLFGQRHVLLYLAHDRFSDICIRSPFIQLPLM